MLFDTVEQPDIIDAPGSAAANPAPSAKETQAEEPQTEALDGAATPDPEIDTDPPEPEDAELEYEGKKFKVPKDLEEELKGALLRHSDYTKKTQGVAAERQEVAVERESLKTARAQHEQQVQVHQALSQDIARITAVDQRLAQLQTVNLQALSAQDPIQAQNLLIELNQLQSARGQMVGSITQKQQHLQYVAQQDFAKRADNARAFLMREFKDWSPEKDRALEAYAVRKGINTQALSQFLINEPAIARVLDEGMRAEESAKQRAAAKPKPDPAPKPISRVGGAAASNTKAISDMTPEEHQAWRREYKSKRR